MSDDLLHENVMVDVVGARLTLMWLPDDERWLVLDGLTQIGELALLPAVSAGPWPEYRPNLGDGFERPTCDDWRRVLDWMLGARDDLVGTGQDRAASAE